MFGEVATVRRFGSNWFVRLVACVLVRQRPEHEAPQVHTKRMSQAGSVKKLLQ